MTPTSRRPSSTGSATLLLELGAVQAVEQRIAELTESGLDALAGAAARRAGR